MRDLENLFDALERSAFRRRFRLKPAELHLLRERGMSVVLQHARELIQNRLAPAAPRNDGDQTPMRGHPVFVAQHATATCCRSCLARWHGIEKARALREQEMCYVIRVIERWLTKQAANPIPMDRKTGEQTQLTLFDSITVR